MGARVEFAILDCVVFRRTFWSGGGEAAGAGAGSRGVREVGRRGGFSDMPTQQQVQWKGLGLRLGGLGAEQSS